jgi:hypothetical protein
VSMYRPGGFMHPLITYLQLFLSTSISPGILVRRMATSRSSIALLYATNPIQACWKNFVPIVNVTKSIGSLPVSTSYPAKETASALKPQCVCREWNMPTDIPTNNEIGSSPPWLRRRRRPRHRRPLQRHSFQKIMIRVLLLNTSSTTITQSASQDFSLSLFKTQLMLFSVGLSVVVALMICVL